MIINVEYDHEYSISGGASNEFVILHEKIRLLVGLRKSYTLRLSVSCDWLMFKIGERDWLVNLYGTHFAWTSFDKTNAKK